MTEEVFDRILDIDLRTPYFCSIAAAKVMMKKRRRKDCKHFFGQQPDDECRTIALLHSESRDQCDDKRTGGGMGYARNKGQCCSAWLDKTAMPSLALKTGLLTEEQGTFYISCTAMGNRRGDRDRCLLPGKR